MLIFVLKKKARKRERCVNSESISRSKNPPICSANINDVRCNVVICRMYELIA